MIQYNVYRATWMNLALVTPAAIKSEDHLSRINIDPEALPPLMPPSLIPTALQRRVRHMACIDAAPHPVLRDNMILASGTYDEDVLCLDLLGGLFYGNYPGGSGLTSGAVFGRKAGKAAADWASRSRSEGEADKSRGARQTAKL